jgi:hypothetical protein
VDVAHHAAYQSFSLPLLCYYFSAVLVLNPWWVVTGEWSACHFTLNSAPFKAMVIHLDTSHTYPNGWPPFCPATTQ